MNRTLITALSALAWIGVYSVAVAEHPAAPSRQPHPPTSLPPATSKPGPKPTAPPSLAGRTSPKSKEVPPPEATPVSNRRESYLVFTAAALLLLRKPESP